MTDYWRGHERRDSQHETSRTPSRSRNGRPPPGTWHPSVPSWEKRFCTSVCFIPWRKVCETQRMMQYCYQNIVEWDDSAGEVALKNAKERYWASINGLPCDISLPDPDLYIDKVDWDCKIDPELIADLERQPSIAEGEDNDEKLDFWGNGWDDRPVPCTGWGDEPESTVVDNNNKGGGVCNGWESFMNQPAVCTGWDDTDGPARPSKDTVEPESTFMDNNNNGGGVCNGWDSNVNQPVVCTGWDDTDGHVLPHKETVEAGWGNYDSNAASTSAWDSKGWGSHGSRGDSGACESRHSNGNSWENGCPSDSWGGWGRWESNPNKRNSDYYKSRPWGTWNGNGKRRGKGGGGGDRWNGSRHSSSTRYEADDRQMNGGGRNSKGRKRSSFIHENPNINKRSLAPSQWHSMRYCGPVTHYGPTQVSSTWRSWEKQVS